MDSWNLRARFLSQIAEPGEPLGAQTPLAVEAGEGDVDRDSDSIIADEVDVVLEP
jgi:hypothetical protein